MTTPVRPAHITPSSPAGEGGARPFRHCRPARADHRHLGLPIDGALATGRLSQDRAVVERAGPAARHLVNEHAAPAGARARGPAAPPPVSSQSRPTS